MTKDIAIIGISGQFPDANDMNGLMHNLLGNKNSIRQIDSDRIRETCLSSEKEYLKCAYLKDIDKFDHAFFNIPKSEADLMCPSQRLILQSVYKTMNNASCSIESMSGSKTAIFCSLGQNDYFKRVDNNSALRKTGEMNSFLVSKISRFFNWSGAFTMVDTACSSSLMALYLAFGELLAGRAEQSLVCGANIMVHPDLDKNSNDFEMWSPDGISKAFSSDSKGMSRGEAVVSVLLKPLKKAILDQNIIHGVLRSVAVNNNANKTISVTDPSSIAQEELALEAWKEAGIEPTDIDFIEMHGSGTNLGDKLEVEGLNNAFRKFSNKTGICPVSSVKSNVGHGISISCLNGLAKAILTIKTGNIFPNEYYDKKRSVIDSGSALFVNKELMAIDQKKKVRNVCVASTGISGLNGHIVLSSLPDDANKAAIKKEVVKNSSYLFTVSSKSIFSLKEGLKMFNRELDKYTDKDLSDISYTLNAGRSHFDHRCSFVSNSINDLKKKITKQAKGISNLTKITDPPQLTLIFSDSVGDCSDEIRQMKKYPVFLEHYSVCLKHHKGKLNKRIKAFAFQYGLYFLFKEYGLKTTSIIGHGLGDLVSDVITGEKKLKAAIRELGETVPKHKDEAVFAKRTIRYAKSQMKKYYIGLAPDSKLIKTLKDAQKKEKSIEVFGLDDVLNKKAALLEVFNWAYSKGIEVSWSDYYKNNKGTKLELFTYQFRKDRCWHKEEGDNNRDRVDRAIETTSLSKSQGSVEIDKYKTVMAITDFFIEILGGSDIAEDSDFFELGGHSLLVNKLINRIRDRYGISLVFNDIFENSTPQSITNLIMNRKKIKENVIKPVSRNSKWHKLSHAQKRIWVLSKLNPGSCVYNICSAHDLKGDLNVALLKKAFEKIVDRHEAFRTCFTEIGGEPRQSISNNPNVNIIEIDTQKIKNKKSKSEVLEKAINKYSTKPFAIDGDALFRVVLIKNDQNGRSHTLLLVMHHLICDGMSLEIIYRDLAYVYNSLLAGEEVWLPQIKTQYTDYVKWEQDNLDKQEFKNHEKYWLSRLSRDTYSVDIPFDHPRPPLNTYKGNTKRLLLDKKILRSIKKFSLRSNTTVHTFLLTVFNSFLYKLTGQTDLVVGVPIGERGNIELENVVGLFVNTVVSKFGFNGNESYDELLKIIDRQLKSDYEHKNYPFERLVEKINPERDMGRSPLFNIMFQVDLASARNIELAGIKMVKKLVNTHTSMFDLKMRIMEQENEDTIIACEYSTSLFKDDTISFFLEMFQNIIKEIVEKPTVKLTELNLLRINKKQEILSLNKGKELTDDRFRTVQQMFEVQAEKTPNEIAVTYLGKNVTYSELNKEANKVAHYLRENKKVSAGMVIGLMTDNNLDLVIGILGVLKSGGAYVILSPGNPQKYNIDILANCKAEILLTRKGAAKKFAVKNKLEIIDIKSKDIFRENNGNLKSVNKRSDTAYVIHTSGSTGKPKAVAISHENLLNFIIGVTNEIKFERKKKVLSHTTFLFDIFFLETILPLTQGATVLLLSESEKKNPEELKRVLYNNQVELVQMTPTHLNFYLTDTKHRIIFKNVKKILVGGESWEMELAKKLWKYTKADVYNMYGPVETTIWSAIKRVSVGSSITIGKPIINTNLYVLNGDMQPQPLGVPGELYISGKGLAKGYINNSVENNRAFRDNPFDKYQKIYKTGDMAVVRGKNNIEIIGRIDQQLKIRGQRVEPAYIEAEIKKIIEVKDVVVAGKQPKNKKSELALVAYYTRSKRDKINSEKIRSKLKLVLPGYMIPSYFIDINRLPVNQNGKVDKNRLPAPENSSNSKNKHKKPNSIVEKKVVDIWQRVLGADKIGVNDNFFELGGHSLMAIKIQSEINREFGISLPFATIFINPTPEVFSKKIEDEIIEKIF